MQWIVGNIRFSMILRMTVPKEKKKQHVFVMRKLYDSVEMQGIHSCIKYFIY